MGLIQYYIKIQSMVLTVLALAEYPALRPRAETLAILLLAFRLLALATLLHSIEFHPDPEPVLYLWLLLLESLRVPRQGVNHSLLVAFIWLAVPTSHAIAILIAVYLQVEALTVHLEAFGLAAVAPHLLDLDYLLGALPLLDLYLDPGGFGGGDAEDGPLPGCSGLLDVHHVVAELGAREGEEFEGAVGEV